MRDALSPILLLLALAGCATFALRPSELSLDEKVGQLFVCVARGTFVNESSPEYKRLVGLVRDHHVGGIHWSLSNVYETAVLNQHLQRLARVPLLVSADLESGVGMRFADTTFWPWAMGIAATGDPSLAQREGRIVAEEARAIGLNEIYAPVADVNVNPENPVINVRSFGEDPEAVARFVAAFVRGVESGGVMATAKHFPGHGDTQTDSHRSLPVLNITRGRLERVELVPFRAAIAAGVSSIMMAHLSFPALDATPAPPRQDRRHENPYTKDDSETAQAATMPASLSREITEGLLRRELKFDGLVVTDALDMGGITDHFDAGEAAVRAVLAGADQILKSTDAEAAMAAVRRAVAEGRISRDRLDASVGRVLAAKARVGPAQPDFDLIFRVVDSPEHRAVAEEIARRSLTLVREEPDVLPIRRERRVVHVFVNDGSQGSVADDLSRELKTRLSDPPLVFLLDPRSTEQDAETALGAASRADLVILSLSVRFQSGKGAIAMPDLAKRTAERVLALGIPTIGIAFGTPYLLRDLPQLRTYLVAYGAQKDVQRAAARALFGEAAIGGRLPVTIPGLAPRGSGIDKPAIR